jgi:iron complex transport system substrate-binding protein
MTRRFAACLLGLAFALAQLANADDGLRDDRGKLVALATPPQRIVSLLPSLTESVCAIGACARLVGTDRFSNWPASVAALPKLGGFDDVRIEAVVALKPDVVLVSPSARVIDRLEQLGLKVIVLDSRNRADVRRTLTLLARMMGDPAAGESAWAAIQRQTRAAAALVPPSVRGLRVYFEVDPTPYAAGPGSFIGETLIELGMVNALPADLGPFPKPNPEYVVRLQPDIVIASAHNLADMARRPGWSALRALHDGRSCGFASERFELLVRPGPRMGEAATRLAECLAALGRPRR